MIAPVVIKAGSRESEQVILGHLALAAICFKATGSPNTISVLGSFDGTTFYPLRNDSGSLAFSTAGPAMILLDKEDFIAPQFVQFVLEKSLDYDFQIHVWKHDW